MRCFVAVELGPAARKALAERVEAERSRARGRQGGARDIGWSNTGQLHVTLKFLGEVDDALVPEVCAVVSEVSRAIAPFSLALAGFGAFPAPRSPRVLWCGMEDPSGACAAWLRAAEPRFEALGFDPERRLFRPHVTLARSRSPSGTALLTALLSKWPPPAPCETLVEEIVLFQSVLGRGGAVHTPLLRAGLEG